MAPRRRKGSTLVAMVLLVLGLLLYAASPVSGGATVNPSEYTTFYGEVLTVSREVTVFPYGIKKSTVARGAQGDTPATAIVMGSLNPDDPDQNPRTALTVGNYVYKVQVEFFPGGHNWVDTDTSDVDVSPNKGTHSNFANQQAGPDSVYDTLTEEGAGQTVSETRYMRSDQQTVNGLTAYILRATQSTTSLSTQVTETGSGGATVYWGIRVWKRSSGGGETEITSGTPVAQVSRSSAGEGLQSATWSCPLTSIETTDAVVVRVYIKVGALAWQQGAAPPNFITEQLGGSQLNSVTWTAYYYTKYETVTGGSPSGRYTRGTFYWGDSTYNSRIENFNYAGPSNFQLDLEVQWTSADFNKPNPTLCIYVGAVDPDENIKVDVWYSSTWNTVINPLVSGWNNVSIASYLNNEVFTIRFKGVTETSDTTQDSWQIDATILRTGDSPASPTPPNTTYRIDLKVGENLVGTLYVKSSSSPIEGDLATPWFNIGASPPETQTSYQVEVTRVT